MTLTGLEPARVWHHFAALSAWPRCSGACSPVLDHLAELAKSWGREVRRDSAGNLVVVKAASAGKEASPTVVLQAHVDMVCEQNRGRGHDFARQGPSLIVEDGWVRADGTTLGADNGIGVAVLLALLEDSRLVHGPLEALFTFDEETDMGGATRLDPSLISGRILLNLDGEDRGHFVIGTAGGQTTTSHLPFATEKSGLPAWSVALTGLPGGHSGVEIHRQTGNALVLLARWISEALDTDGGRSLALVSFEGGDKDNAIPREALAVISTLEGRPPVSEATLREALVQGQRVFRSELGPDGANLSLSLVHAPAVERALTSESSRRLLDLLLAFPHGVLGMSRIVPSLVETSANLARVTTATDAFEILSSERSSSRSQLAHVGQRVHALARLAGGRSVTSGYFPPWSPDPSSRLAQLAPSIWQELTGTTPVVELIHAGVECSLLGEKFPGMDMISFGAHLQDIHTPRERVEVASVAEHYRFTQALLEALA